MPKRLSRILITMIIMGALTGCDDDADSAAKTPTSSDNLATEQTVTDIDWSQVASSEPPAERATYNYPFDLDSQNVRDYANFFKVDNATAQHNLTVGMASNEALSKVLDQLSTSYTSHELTDDDNIKLIIHTTADINASNYDYVFKEDFAKGLVLPIEIKPDGVKSETDVHVEMEK